MGGPTLARTPPSTAVLRLWLLYGAGTPGCSSRDAALAWEGQWRFQVAW